MSKRILIVIGLSAFLLCVSCRQGQHAVLRDIEQAYNDHDTAGLMRFFTDDVALEVENKEISTGKTELRGIIDRLHARDSHLHFRNCRGGDPDILGTGWSYEHTREEVIGMAERAGYKLERLETALLPHDYLYVFRPEGVSGLG